MSNEDELWSDSKIEEYIGTLRLNSRYADSVVRTAMTMVRDSYSKQNQHTAARIVDALEMVEKLRADIVDALEMIEKLRADKDENQLPF